MAGPARFARPVFLVASLLLAGGALAQEGQPPAGVTVETLQPQSVVLTATLPGRVRASAETQVRPQVNGIITERLFDEGSHVEEGDVLYRIDRASYEAAVASARAAVAQAEAQLRGAEREAERVQKLQERGISSQSTEDTAISSRDVAQAQYQVAQAQMQAAQIDLDRTEIRARLSGQVGFSQVSAGELVTASQANALTTIRRLDPVDVDVTQSAAELIAWRRGTIAGDTPDTAREVTLTLADGGRYEQSGLLTAAEPHVDEQTGVIVLRTSFANPDGLLLPGMYVQVEMPTGTADNVFLVPQEGVSRDRRGNPTALVVNAEDTVEQRNLTILQDRGSDWVVSDGLNPGDRVIVAGLQRASPGAKVAPTERAPEDTAATGGQADAQAAEGAQPADGQADAEAPGTRPADGQADAAADAQLEEQASTQPAQAKPGGQADAQGSGSTALAAADEEGE